MDRIEKDIFAERQAQGPDRDTEDLAVLMDLPEGQRVLTRLLKELDLAGESRGIALRLLRRMGKARPRIARQILADCFDI